MHYLVGDLQGCCGAFDRLLADIGFSPSRDRLLILGDLVNRGPESLATLERIAALGEAAQGLLGYHDLHLLAVAHGVRSAHRSDTFDDVLGSSRRAQWIEWLRQRPLALEMDGWLCIHAGVPAAWSREQTLALAGEVQAQLRGPDLQAFLQTMYGNEPSCWDDALAGPNRWRFVINALTRMRFVDAEGRLDFKLKSAAAQAPPGWMPWYRAPGRRTEDTPVAFGHWSTLGLVDAPNLLALDTGCVWGGALTAARVDGGRRELIQVACEASQQPGD